LSPIDSFSCATIFIPNHHRTQSKMDFGKLVGNLRHTFKSNLTKDLAFRREQLNNFYRMIVENEKRIVTALHQDLRKCEYETNICEILLLKNEVRLMIDNLNKFAKQRPITKTLGTLFDNVYTRPEPLGVVLIISAWNYPIYLTLTPLIGAIAAGNCAIIKPSELSPASATLIEELVEKFLDQRCFKVVNGGKEETTSLLNERFDKILYTGSTRVGKIVYQKAAEHLTPCVLELGGKSPCYVADDAMGQIEEIAKRIAFGKTVCLGQTCVAPDYILCSREMQDKLVESIPKAIAKNYGSANPEDSNEICRIINETHFERLRNLIESSRDKVAVGGHLNKDKLWISPTILTNINGDEPIMQEEIFGPLLPIKVVNSVDEAIEFINAREKPLSLYIFSTNDRIKNRILNETSSGSVCINDTLLQLTVETLPFGGVGHSGMGAYHGKASFDTFSHEKSIMDHSMNPIVKMLEMSRYAPYTNLKSTVLRELLTYRWTPDLGVFSTVLWFIFGLASAVAAQLFTRK